MITKTQRFDIFEWSLKPRFYIFEWSLKPRFDIFEWSLKPRLDIFEWSLKLRFDIFEWSLKPRFPSDRIPRCFCVIDYFTFELLKWSRRWTGARNLGKNMTSQVSFIGPPEKYLRPYQTSMTEPFFEMIKC